MSYTRQIGYVLNNLIKNGVCTRSELKKVLHLSDFETDKLISGRLFLSMKDIRIISHLCNVNILQCVKQHKNDYYDYVVNCTTHKFTNKNNMDLILSYIDSYIDLKELEYKNI